MKLGITPKRLPISLAPVLKRMARSAGLERAAEGDRGLVDAGAGLGVQAFDGHAEGRHLVHQRIEEAALVTHAQQRVAEHARRDRLGPTPRLAAQLCGVSAKLNHSNSMPAMAAKPSFSARASTRLSSLARAHREGRAVGVDELAQEERHAAVPGHAARGDRSSRASASGKPCCQPVTWVLS
jgi:hypothetical protein